MLTISHGVHKCVDVSFWCACPKLHNSSSIWSVCQSQASHSEHSTLSVSLQVRETIECWVYPASRTYSGHTDLQNASEYMWVHFVAELAKMAALKLSQLISQARDCILHLLSQLWILIHIHCCRWVLSLWLAGQWMRTMAPPALKQNYELCKYVLFILFIIRRVSQHM